MRDEVLKEGAQVLLRDGHWGEMLAPFKAASGEIIRHFVREQGHDEDTTHELRHDGTHPYNADKDVVALRYNFVERRSAHRTLGLGESK